MRDPADMPKVSKKPAAKKSANPGSNPGSEGFYEPDQPTGRLVMKPGEYDKVEAAYQQQKQQAADQQSLMDQITALTGGGTPNFAGDASGQIASAYAPLFKELDRQKADAVARAARNDKDIQGMYGALQGTIQQGGKDLAASVARSNQDVRNSYASSDQQILGNSNTALDQLARLAKLSGSEAALPDAGKTIVGDSAFLRGIGSQNSARAQTLNANLGTNAVAFNDAQRNMAGFAGNDARANNQKELGKFVSNLSQQSASAKQQQGSQAANLAQQMQAGYLSNQQAQVNGILQQYQNKTNQDFELQKMAFQNQLDLNKQQASKQLGGSGYDGDKVMAAANQVFGGNSAMANKAMELITHIDANSVSAADFANKLVQANRKLNYGLSDAALQNLGLTMFGITNPRYSPYYQGTN